MNLQQRSSRILTLLVVCLASLTAPAMTASRGSNNRGAVAAVHSFYRFHFAHDKYFLKQSVVQRRRWFAPELYRLLIYELRRYDLHSRTHPDDAPYIEGDPFTDSQEYPDTYRVGSATIESNGRVFVPVNFFWHGRLDRKIKVEMTQRGGVWLIRNLHYEGDEADLLTQLRRPVYDSEVKRSDR